VAKRQDSQKPTLALSEPPKGRNATPVTRNALEVRTEIDLGSFYDRLFNRTAQLLEDYGQRGLSGQELADAVVAGLNELSDAPLERSGRGATAEAYNLGRNLEIQGRLPEAGAAVRSAILDTRTCENCIALDGAVCEINGPVVDIKPDGAALLRENGVDPSGPDAYFALMPPNFCLGEDLCRDQFLYRRAAA